jgi:hypothetical protein
MSDEMLKIASTRGSKWNLIKPRLTTGRRFRLMSGVVDVAALQSHHRPSF